MAYVTLKNVKKIYPGKVVAVQDFNLEIRDKEFVVLVGPSGCGKSTTLRMIAGLEDITEGDLFIGEERMNDVAPKDRDIAMVFQNYALYPHMTVYENMAFALKLRRAPKAEIDKKVREAAEILDITSYLDRKPKALSGGQRQRVAIGRAIVREPQVFLMDEPLSNLDAKLRNQMRAEIIKLRHRIDTTFVYVTHDQTEAMTLGDRIVIMKDGFIQQIGTPQEVFNHPANVFVAGFIGSPQMNLFDAQLRKDDEKYFVEVAGASFALSERIAAKLRRDSEGEVIVGIRPEHIRICAQEGDDTMSAAVEVSEMMGSEIHLHLRAQDKEIVLRVNTTELPEAYRAGIPYGTQLHFTFPGDLLHLFDKESQKNLIGE
ncbi:MAG: sn-glycerol-3-phosphate ABC transporter ATP-binding protein UgpC [Oscillospiraceae bacterium]|jgi:multiple sugar transport system ATP-binding protein|nr:sn-glycerol-3-phosphate ABC transporter ATP-binding protein UgpC [Oscillospiraceae bacterium]